MKFAITFATALLFFATAAYADPASTESIEELLVTTKVESLMNSYYGNIETMMRQMMTETLKGKTLDEKQKAFIDSLPAKVSKVVREELSWSSLKPMYVQIYRESFTQQEVDGLIAFYKSPAGVAMTNKMPLVMQQSTTLVQQRLVPLMEKMQEAVQQSLQEAGIVEKR